MVTIAQPPGALTETIADQVRDALLRHQDAIERPDAVAKTLHVECELTRAGAVRGLTFFVEHAIPVRRQLGIEERAR
jgi:hypothetical protein